MLFLQTLRKPFFMSDCTKMTEISHVSCGHCSLRVNFRFFVLHQFHLAQLVLLSCYMLLLICTYASSNPKFLDIQRNIYKWTISYPGATLKLNLSSTKLKHGTLWNKLRSWASNSISLQKIATANKTIDLNTTVQILGLLWNTCIDAMSLARKSLPSSNIVFKCSVLQDSSQILDPLGSATPVSIHAKILLQEIWQQKRSWNTPLSEELRHKWLNICSDILELSQLSFPRAYFPHRPGSGNDHLYVFADASMKAYGAIVYLCNNHDISFVLSKGCVAPIKALTLPKLELMAAVATTRVAKFVQASLSANQHLIPVHLWTDSQIILHWINNGCHSNSFVYQRVTVILMSFPSTDWSFTPSADNPADLLTRGISTEQLKSSELWRHGPNQTHPIGPNRRQLTSLR